MIEVRDRYAHFQYIKETLKESQDYLISGLDIGKNVQHACFMLSSTMEVLWVGLKAAERLSCWRK